MSTPSLNPTSPPTPNGRSAKINKLRKVIVLKLQPDLLAQFLPKPVPRANFKPKSSPSLASTSNNLSAAAPIAHPSSTDEASESNSTPVPTTDQPTTEEIPKKTGSKGPKPGSKRGLGLGSDSMPKPRGKPGPKKKPRLDDGTIDRGAGAGGGGGVKTVVGAVAPISTHKLGPKANQGAINAGLRALDRSGRPCRKWERKPFQLKSFTGVVWELPSWRAPTSQYHNGDYSSDGKDASASNSKANDSSTAAESSGGDLADPMILSTPAPSSPAPAPATPTVAVEG